MFFIWGFSGLMVKLGMTVETTHPQSMEEVQKAAKEIHLYSYQSSAMNVEQGIQWNGRSFAVSAEFEEWLCEHILRSQKKMRNRKHLLCTAAWKARALLPVRLHAANMLKHHIVTF